MNKTNRIQSQLNLPSSVEARIEDQFTELTQSSVNQMRQFDAWQTLDSSQQNKYTILICDSIRAELINPFAKNNESTELRIATFANYKDASDARIRFERNHGFMDEGKQRGRTSKELSRVMAVSQ